MDEPGRCVARAGGVTSEVEKLGRGAGHDWAVPRPAPKLASVRQSPASKGTGQSRTDLALRGADKKIMGALGAVGAGVRASRDPPSELGLVMDGLQSRIPIPHPGATVVAVGGVV